MPLGPHAADWSRTGVVCRYGCLIAADAKSIAKRASKRGVRRTDLERLVEATEGICMVCRICHATVVEHCHATGRVRGITCAECNARIGHLEGATYWPPIYSGGCPCLPSVSTAEHAAGLYRLEQATYRFIDHAMDPIGHDRLEALAWLSTHPFPSPDSPRVSVAESLAALPRTYRYARDAARLMQDAAWIADRQQPAAGDRSADAGSTAWALKSREHISADVLAAYGGPSEARLRSHGTSARDGAAAGGVVR